LLAPQHDSVTVAQIIATLNQNAGNAQNVLREAIKTMRGRAVASVARRWRMRF